MQFALRTADLPCSIGTQPFQRQSGSGDESAQPLDPLTLVWRTRHRRIQRESVTRSNVNRRSLHFVRTCEGSRSPD